MKATGIRLFFIITNLYLGVSLCSAAHAYTIKNILLVPAKSFYHQGGDGQHNVNTTRRADFFRDLYEFMAAGITEYNASLSGTEKERFYLVDSLAPGFKSNDDIKKFYKLKEKRSDLAKALSGKNIEIVIWPEMIPSDIWTKLKSKKKHESSLHLKFFHVKKDLLRTKKSGTVSIDNGLILSTKAFGEQVKGNVAEGIKFLCKEKENEEHIKEYKEE